MNSGQLEGLEQCGNCGLIADSFPASLNSSSKVALVISPITRAWRGSVTQLCESPRCSSRQCGRMLSMKIRDMGENLLLQCPGGIIQCYPDVKDRCSNHSRTKTFRSNFLPVQLRILSPINARRKTTVCMPHILINCTVVDKVPCRNQASQMPWLSAAGLNWIGRC